MMCPLQGTPSYIANEKADRLSKNDMLYSWYIRFALFPLYGCVRCFGPVPSAQPPCRSSSAMVFMLYPASKKHSPKDRFTLLDAALAVFRSFPVSMLYFITKTFKRVWCL